MGIGIGIGMGVSLSTPVVPTLPLLVVSTLILTISRSLPRADHHVSTPPYSNQDWVELGPPKYIAVTLASMLFLLISRFHPAATRTAKGMAICSSYLLCGRHQAGQFVPHGTTGQVGCLQARPAPPIRGQGLGFKHAGR